MCKKLNPVVFPEEMVIDFDVAIQKWLKNTDAEENEHSKIGGFFNEISYLLTPHHHVCKILFFKVDRKIPLSTK